MEAARSWQYFPNFDSRFVELHQCIYHLLLLLASDLRVHREGKDFFGQFLGDWKGARAVAQMRVCLLKMERNWIMDPGADILLSQVFLQLIALLRPDDIQVVHCTAPTWFRQC